MLGSSENGINQTWEERCIKTINCWKVSQRSISHSYSGLNVGRNFKLPGGNDNNLAVCA